MYNQDGDKMVNNGNNRNCGFGDVMVSYIYDEITTVDRRKFETHLVDCSTCTEEFAEISGARFSMFEWQKESFSELLTPEIVIPYAKARRVEAEASGFFAGLRGLFGGYGIPVSAAAAILIGLGIGFAVFMAINRDNDVIADVHPVKMADQPKVHQNVADEKLVIKENPVVVGSGDDVAADVVNEIEPARRDIKPVKAVAESKRSRPARQLTAEIVDRTKRIPQTRKAPALSNFDEADDKSLRLTDLFDDGTGSIR